MPLSGAERQKRFKVKRQKRDRKVKAFIDSMPPEYLKFTWVWLVPVADNVTVEWQADKEIFAGMSALAKEHCVDIHDVLQKILEMAIRGAEHRVKLW